MKMELSLFFAKFEYLNKYTLFLSDSLYVINWRSEGFFVSILPYKIIINLFNIDLSCFVGYDFSFYGLDVSMRCAVFEKMWQVAWKLQHTTYCKEEYKATAKSKARKIGSYEHIIIYVIFFRSEAHFSLYHVMLVSFYWRCDCHNYAVYNTLNQ